MEVVLNEDSGSPGMGSIVNTGTTFSYPEDQWYLTEVTVDLDNSTATVTIDGVEVETAYDYPGTQLGAINFWSIDAANRYYIDDVLFEELPPAVVTVTFTVDMAMEMTSAEGVFLSGSFKRLA